MTKWYLIWRSLSSNQVVGVESVEIETQLGMMIIDLTFSGQMDHRPAMWDRFDDQAAVGG